MKNVIKVGIDLGTTNTVVCYEKSDGEYDFLKFGNAYLLPSVAYVEENNNIIVGERALKKGCVRPSRYIKSSKTHMGEYGFSYPKSVEGMNFGINLSPTDVATNILKEVKRVITTKIPGADEAEIEAVITIPAYFTINQEEETEKAGINAGLKVKMTLSEPVSAAIAYVTENIQDNTKIFVVDFGGGTLDITLLEYNSKTNTYNCLAKAGDNKLGGDNIDDCIIKIFTDIIKDDTGINLSSQKTSGMSVDEYWNVMSQIRTEAIKAKIALSDDDDYDAERPDLFEYDGESYDFETNITIDEFNEACKPVYDRLIRLIEKMIDERNIDISSIDRVLMVGGSCYIPKVREIIRAVFNRDIYDDLDLSKVVALGACIVANQELEDAEGKTFISEINAHDFGVEVRDVNKPYSYFSTIVERNSSFPCSKTRDYKTVTNEPVMVNVYERNANVDPDNDSLESCDFFGSILFEDFQKSASGGALVSINFDFDAQKRLTVTITDKATGVQTKTKLEKSRKLELKRATKPMDIFVVIDSSGSMESDFIEVKKACCSLIDSIDLKNNNIGVIQFDDSYNVVSELSNNSEKLKAKVHAVSTGGCTYMAGAFRAAQSRFTMQSGRNSVVIMLTDGQAHDANQVIEASITMKNKGTRIISIGVGNGYNAKFLKEISTLKDGKSDVYEIKTIDKLTETFETIANSLQEV